MQTNEIVGQIRQLARLPEMDQAAIAKHPVRDTRAKQPHTDVSRPFTAKQPEVGDGSSRNSRRFGAGF